MERATVNTRKGERTRGEQEVRSGPAAYARQRGAIAPADPGRGDRVATERGYEGTTIALVSKKCGLPPIRSTGTSHKDDLIAAVIERSSPMAAAWQVPGEAPHDRRGLGMQVAKALLDSPDFLRLGLMLALERRPVEPRARAMFLQVARRRPPNPRPCGNSHRSSRTPDNQLVIYAIAGADGLFIAKELGGDSVDLLELFELHAWALYDTALRLVSGDAGQ